jgi:predicted ATPase
MKQFGSFVLDTANERLWHEGVQIALAYKPFSVLRYLVENAGRLITHDELLEALWPTTYVQPQVLRTYVQELRKALDDDAKHPGFIQTLPKRGYSFVARVSESSALEAAKTPGNPTSDPSTAALIGRDVDLIRLQELAQLAVKGQRQLVFITGPSGIGKTALLSAFCEAFAASSPQARMACGHCVEGLSEKEDYHPIIEVFDQLFASEDRERERRIRAITPQSGRPIEPTTETIAAHVTGFASGATIRNGPSDQCEALEELAQEQVLVLLMEDIQWAHQSTLELISALARRSRPAKLMVLATYRPQGRSTDLDQKSMKQDLQVRHLCTELLLVPLSKKEIKQLLNQLLQQENLPSGLEDFVYQRSEGNPHIALALLDHMIAEGFLVRIAETNEERWDRGQRIPFTDMEIGVPCELAKRIELEIDRLSPEEQRVLEAGSLMSIAFPVWAVAAVLERDSDYVEELSDNLARRTGLVHRAGHDDLPDGTQSDFYTFTHDFYREALYQRQPTGRRAKGHIRIAERLRELFAGREANVGKEIATQYEAAGNWPRTANALRDAARHAHARHAYQESIQLLEHCLRIAENMGDTERVAIAKEIERELSLIRETIGGPSREQKVS